MTISLDGEDWLTAPDPTNAGRDEHWWESSRHDARSTRIPWVFLADFKNYHGVMWYWRRLTVPANPLPSGRTLLRFWAVHYKADVWVNGVAVGSHEGAETPFAFDVTGAVKPGAENLIAVRVLNPTKATPIDGLLIDQVPHRWPTSELGDFSQGGNVYNYGGILDSVELLIVPAFRIDDLYVHPDPATGEIRTQIKLSNSGKPAAARLEFIVSEARTGAVVKALQLDVGLSPGENRFDTRVDVKNPRLWQLNDPHLYRVTVRAVAADTGVFDEQSTQCGFRDFRLKDGYFALNGKRLFLRSSHTGNGAPIGYILPPRDDPDMLRRDLVIAKTMGFNTIRFLCGMPTRGQLELCDQIGMLVYEESYASWYMENSPQMAARFDSSVSGMILRDRNHPSVVIWGLLNETPAWEHRHDALQSDVFEHAVRTLPLVRSLDDTRLVFLSSGRFDGHLDVGSVSNPGSNSWQYLLGAEGPNAGMTEPAPGFTDMSLTGSGVGYLQGVGDAHIYPALPHSPRTIQFLRTVGQGTKHVWISEYGYDPALDLSLVARHYEQLGQADYSSAYYRSGLDRFMQDWSRWNLAECFGRPEDYFHACIAAQPALRTLGLNAIRSNPNLVGYSLTGLVDGYTGEGLITYFHELKPGMVDAISDGLAPLRWCLFAGAPDVYRGGKVKLEAVLANEDVLLPGTYQARMEVFGPQFRRVFNRIVTFAIPDPQLAARPPLALSIFSEEVAADWPEGNYRFVATLEHGGAAAGGAAEFHLADPAAMPPVPTEVVLWGEDRALSGWLSGHGIRTRHFTAADADLKSGVILAGTTPPPGGVAAFQNLARIVKQGVTAVLLDPNLFKFGAAPADLSCLGLQGKLIELPNIITIADYWAKHHPIFNGLPCGGLMDYGFYRDLLSPQAWQRSDVPKEVIAGGIVSSPNYASGLALSVDRLGAGRVVLNTLKIEANLGSDPAAERLLRNLINYAGAPSP